MKQVNGNLCPKIRGDMGMYARKVVFMVLILGIIMSLNSCEMKNAEVLPLKNHPTSMKAENGWQNLLADDLSNCEFITGGWELKDGLLTPFGKGDIWTKDEYGNYILDLEFKLAEDTNSGVFLRAGDIVTENWMHQTIEVQIHETADGKLHGECGAIYNCLSPSKTVVKKPGEWNRYTITCKDNKIYIVLNGEQIIDIDLDQWTEAHKNLDGTRNKFNTALKDMPRIGHIGLQYHGHPIWFRNIKIKTI